MAGAEGQLLLGLSEDITATASRGLQRLPFCPSPPGEDVGLAFEVCWRDFCLRRTAFDDIKKINKNHLVVHIYYNG